MHEDYAKSVASLFKTYAESTGKYEFITYHPSDELSPNPSMDELYGIAQKKGATQLAVGELNRIGETVIIAFSLYEIEHGAKLWGDQMQAASPDDLLPVITRMAKSIGSEKKASQDDDIYNVTDGESQELKTVRSFTSFGIQIGGGPLLSHNLDNGSPAGFGFRVSNDARHLIFDIAAEFYFSDYNIYMIGLDVIKPFSTKNNSPYVNGGISFGGGTLNDTQVPAQYARAAATQYRIDPTSWWRLFTQ